MKTALTISGSDSSGGAGVQADLKTFAVLGVYGMSAITALTAQNTLGIKETFEVAPDLVRQQIDVAAGDIQVDACKTGMLANLPTLEAVSDCIKRGKLQPYVCDPVVFAKSGKRLLKDEALDALKRWLFPLATVVTPNLREAAALTTGVPATALASMPAAKDAAKRLAGTGAKAVVLKAIPAGDQTVDLYFDGREFLEFAAPTMPAEKSHGSGDAFSAAIAAGLAQAMEPVAAIDRAKQLVSMAIQYSDGQGRGTAPVNVLAFAPKKK